MPVRINLLPRYVVLKKIFQRALIACVAGVVLWTLVLLLIYANKQVELRTLEASIQNIEPAARATEAAQSAKKKADDAKAPLDASVQFILDASQSGAERSALLDLFRPYIYPGSVISQIDLSDGQNAVIQGMVKTPDDYARFITSLRQGTAPEGPLFADLPVGTNGVPGYPTKQTENQNREGGNAGGGANNDTSGTQLTMVTFPLSVQARGKLLNAITVPTAPGGAPAPQPNDGLDPGMDPGMDPGAPPPP